jgi:hypothetical protein
VIARAQNISVEDARRQVQQYEQQYRQTVDRAKQQATQAADTAAKTVSRAALFGFIVANVEKRLADLLVAGKVTDPMATIAELMGRTARKRKDQSQ